MNKETTTKPEIITTDQRQFEKDTQKHQNFLQFCFDSIDFIQKEANVSLTNEDLTRPNAFNLYMKYFSEMHKDKNQLGISGVKLHDLMSLDLAKIIGIFDKAKVLPHQIKPDIKDYEMYATTPQEIERLHIAKEFLNIMGKLETGINFTQPLKAPVKGDIYTGHAVINPYFVKGVR